MLGDRGKRFSRQGQPARLGGQRAMHDEVGVAPDWRGKMCVARQGQAEMADIVRAVDRLRLAAQHQLVDDLRLRGLPGAYQDPVEQLRPQHLALGVMRNTITGSGG